MTKVLITGGAGFIGLHLANLLLQEGYQIRILDNLHPQIHGTRYQLPDNLSPKTEFILGDIRDEHVLKYALRNIDIVFHLASETGVGQSMYEAGRYARTNVTGTAILWDAIQAVGGIAKLVLASSRAVYGEGTYFCPDCTKRVRPSPRPLNRLEDGLWSPVCPSCSSSMQSVSTFENDLPNPTSVYGITKFTQEQLCLTLGHSYDVPVIILRFFNVYGSGQALNNPYTGILATFLTRIRSRKPLLIYEDGNQLRDFVHVSDVVQACKLAVKSDAPDFQILNVGTGQPISILELAQTLLHLYDMDQIQSKITGEYRVGDIRDCYANIERAKAMLGYKPAVSLIDGLREFSNWADSQTLKDQTDQAAIELFKAGMLRRSRERND